MSQNKSQGTWTAGLDETVQVTLRMELGMGGPVLMNTFNIPRNKLRVAHPHQQLAAEIQEYLYPMCQNFCDRLKDRI